MFLSKRWFLILIFAALVAAGAAWIGLLNSQAAAAATPAPLPTATRDEITSTASPDSRWIALVNVAAGSLDLQQPDGQTVTIFPSGSSVANITWSPDSHILLVVRTNWVFNQPENTGVSSSEPIAIWQVEIKEDKAQPAQKVFESSTPAGQDVAEQIQFGPWSPNSRYVLFWKGILSASILSDGLPASVLDVTTGQVTPVAEVALLNPRYQSWAPNSSALAITAGGYRSAQVDKWLNIWHVGSGQAATVISQTEQIPGVVAWSPKGDVIAYAAVPTDQTGQAWADLMTFDNPAIAGRRIYLLDPLTGQSHRLNQAAAYQDAPLWSDDGAKLYYVQRQGDVIQLMVSEPATGKTEPVPGVNQPIDLNGNDPQVGYYGQADWDALLAQRLGQVTAATEALGIQLQATLTASLPPAPTPDAQGMTMGGFEGVKVLPLTKSGPGSPYWAAFSYGFRIFEPLQNHFVTIYSQTDAGWQEVSRLELENPDYLDPTAVRQVQIEPSRLWLEVQGGAGAHAGTYDLLSFDGQSLRSEVSHSSASPGGSWLEDLNDDGLAEVILDQTDYYVFCYACGVRLVQYEVLSWTGEGLSEVKLSPLSETAPAQLRDLTNRAVELAQAGLWKDALETINRAAALDAQNPVVGMNAVLIKLQAGQDKEAYPLLGHIFYGDYAAALEVLRPYPVEQIFARPTPLISGTVAEGWETELSQRIIDHSTRALQARPELAAAFFLRGWAKHLANPGDPGVLNDIEQAAKLAPQEPLFSQSLTYLKP